MLANAGADHALTTDAVLDEISHVVNNTGALAFRAIIDISIHHSTVQRNDFCLSNVRRAAWVTISKTSCTPSPVRDDGRNACVALIGG